MATSGGVLRQSPARFSHLSLAANVAGDAWRISKESIGGGGSAAVGGRSGSSATYATGIALNVAGVGALSRRFPGCLSTVLFNNYCNDNSD